jgi:hypothetical protein
MQELMEKLSLNLEFKSNFYSIIYHDVQIRREIAKSFFAKFIELFENYTTNDTKRPSTGDTGDASGTTKDANGNTLDVDYEMVASLNLLISSHYDNLILVLNNYTLLRGFLLRMSTSVDKTRLEFCKLFSMLCFSDFRKKDSLVVPAHFKKVFILYLLEADPITSITFPENSNVIISKLIGHYNTVFVSETMEMLSNITASILQAKSHREFMDSFYPLYYYSYDATFSNCITKSKTWSCFNRFLMNVPATFQDFELLLYIFKFFNNVLTNNPCKELIKTLEKSLELLYPHLAAQESDPRLFIEICKCINLVHKESAFNRQRLEITVKKMSFEFPSVDYYRTVFILKLCLVLTNVCDVDSSLLEKVLNELQTVFKYCLNDNLYSSELLTLALLLFRNLCNYKLPNAVVNTDLSFLMVIY